MSVVAWHPRSHIAPYYFPCPVHAHKNPADMTPTESKQKAQHSHSNTRLQLQHFTYTAYTDSFTSLKPGTFKHKFHFELFTSLKKLIVGFVWL